MVIDNEIKDEIREYICSGAARSGRFLSERAVARQFDRKRNLVREVLLALEGEGIVERHPQRGYSYVDYESTDPSVAVLLRYVVEREAARKAVVRRTREDLFQLRDIFDKLELAAREKDMAGFQDADMDFHTALVAASHDNTFIKIFDFMKEALFRRRPDSFSPGHARTQHSHRAILEAFRRGDAELLDRLLRFHLGHHPAVNDFRERELPEIPMTADLPPETAGSQDTISATNLKKG